MNEHLLANVRFYFAQSVFMSNCHYKAYNRLERRRKIISNFVMFFSAVTIILLVLQIIGYENENELLIHVVAFIGLVLTGASLVFELFNKEDTSFLMYQHKDAAEKYKVVRDKLMSLIAEIMSDSSSNEEMLKMTRDKLIKKYSAIGKCSPVTELKDYREAQKSLGMNKGTSNKDFNSGEEFSWSNAEIDMFLPKELRLNND